MCQPLIVYPLEGVADACMLVGDITFELFAGVDTVTDGLVAATVSVSV